MSQSDVNDEASPLGLLPKHHIYPNAGYLGSSSHTALFSHLPVGLEQVMEGECVDFGPHSFSSHSRTVNEAHISHGAQLLTQLCRCVDIPACLNLAKSWLQTGANLVLGGMFTEVCLEAIGPVLEQDAKAISTSLFYNSRQPLLTTSDTTLDEYSAHFNHLNPRWESICLAVIAISRATMGFRPPTGPFPTETQKRHIRRLAMHFSDRCLDICLSLDCLNDLQLILQYENFILHSLVDGDQSMLPPPSQTTILTTVQVTSHGGSWVIFQVLYSLSDITNSLKATAQYPHFSNVYDKPYSHRLTQQIRTSQYSSAGRHEYPGSSVTFVSLVLIVIILPNGRLVPSLIYSPTRAGRLFVLF